MQLLEIAFKLCKVCISPFLKLNMSCICFCLGSGEGLDLLGNGRCHCDGSLLVDETFSVVFAKFSLCFQIGVVSCKKNGLSIVINLLKYNWIQCCKFVESHLGCNGDCSVGDGHTL